ncbi:MAG TPA: elongation factor P [Myxococcales bacterium LLY-WYZ-16_1]|nr:elongation factor P [Myxococcales bacterium LLY-WYZ-16_1]
MATFETSDFRKGLKIIHNNQPYVIVDFQHVKPGKGNQFTRTKIKNLSTGSVLEVTYRSGEKVEDAEVDDRTMSFLYADGSTYHFMDQKTYDQVEITEEALGSMKDFLLPEMSVDLLFWKGRPISIQLPQHVELEITYCEPGVRGDTATNVTKPATVETGATINVPLFINIGDKVKVDTTEGKYIERTSIGNG